MSWCELPDLADGDCAVHSAVAAHALRVSGEPARRVQLLLRFPQGQLDGWAALWRQRGLEPDWVGEGQCYHEAVAIGESSGELRILDATEAVEWTDAACDGIVALRLTGDPAPRRLTWQGHVVQPGIWADL